MKNTKKILSLALAAVLCISPLLANRAAAYYGMGKSGYFQPISAANGRSTAVMSNGDLYTWRDGLLGYDTYPSGGVVVGNTFIMPTPSKVEGLSNVVATSCGMALTADSDLYIWGC